MNLSVSSHDDVVEIALDGRLDAASSPGVQDAINKQINAGHAKIVLDFSKMDYISSSGLRVLLMAVKTLKAKNGRMLIYAANEHVREVFNLAGFVPYFPMYADRQEALAAIQKQDAADTM